jgi:putative nucleotidyltransferase with HDIG domain
MNPTVLFLQTLGQTLAALTLYGDGHPMRATARDRTHVALLRVLDKRGELRISFLDGAVVVGARVLTELRGWEWGLKLAAAGIQRFEIDALPTPTTDALEQFIAVLQRKLVGGPSALLTDAPHGFRVGALGVADANEKAPSIDEMDALLDELAQIPLTAESAAVRWIHDQVADGADVPFAEAELVVSSLALAMQHEQGKVLPLLDILTFDQYSTAHACNVATLAIGVAEQLGLASVDARAIGMAALVHDIGNTRVPAELLAKPGPLTAAEFELVQAHTVEGARILTTRGRGHALAATVAYEHHLWENGQGGYPTLQWPRRSHFASRVVHVCDMYDAMRTLRPYRAALSQAEALRVVRDRSGIEVQGEIVRALVELLEHTPELRMPMEATIAPIDWSNNVAVVAA